MSQAAKVTIGDKTFELPVVVGSEGETALDIRKLRAQTGMITLDDGYGNTGSCSSGVTFLNGEKGILRYRGYPIQQICENSNFVEVAYLLIYGELPNAGQAAKFEAEMKEHALLDENMYRTLATFPASTHPMVMLSALVSELCAFYQGEFNPYDEAQVEVAVRRLLAKMPTIVAAVYRHGRGLPPVYPQQSLSYAGNFLRMMFALPDEAFELRPEAEKAMDKLLILHADHEQNCSTSTVRMVGSSQAGPYAAVVGGINALWGPLHGGANQRVLEMLEAIHKGGGTAKEFVEKAKDKSSGVRLMGFGHRVYKNFDPRAEILKATLKDVVSKNKAKDPLLDIALELEKMALSDQYFVARKLYPNVDFYSGILYRILGVPVKMFTPMFALGRLPGWLAQWKEMTDQRSRIYRPRQIYTGATERDYVPVGDRK